MKQTILLFGKNGQVGRRLYEKFLPIGDVIHLGSKDADFKNPESLRGIIRELQPTVIVNASAYTMVDKAQEDQDSCYAINTKSVEVLTQEANALQAWFIHYSTDFVFDGTKEGYYTEEDPLSPLDVYAKSKALADDYIMKNAERYTIFRVSSVYDDHGHNFAKTILNFAKNKPALRVIHDQTMSPTPAAYIADVTGLALHHILTHSDQNPFKGVFHLTTKGYVSWYDFAVQLIKTARQFEVPLACTELDITPIPTSQYPLPARRPMNCALSTDKLEKTFSLNIPDWTCYIEGIIQNLIEKGFFKL